MTQHSLGMVFVDVGIRLHTQGSALAAPGTNETILWVDSAGTLFKRSGAAGATSTVADFDAAGSNNVLRSAGWGQVATTDLAANAVTQISQADGSTATPTTTSTTFADIPEMSVTLTTTGGPLLVMMDGGYYASGAALTSTFALSLDGAAEVHIRDFNLGATLVTPVSLFHRFTGVSAASHTIKARWKISSGTLTAFSSERSLIVEELKR